MVTTAVQQGIWKLEQNSDTKEMSLYKYGGIVEKWQEESLLSWEQMYEVLLRESYKRRGED